MAEHGVTEQVIGVSFDGTGYGTDGAVWGGEFLIGDLKGFQRAAHLRYVGMPGGDQAIREPWRMALSYALDAGVGDELIKQPEVTLRTVRQMVERRFNTPMTSSAGRLFDAVAALAGLRGRVSFEGQAAMELEWLATGLASESAYPFVIGDDPQSVLIVDCRPVIRAVVQDVKKETAAGRIARRFHSTMVEIIAQVCARLRKTSGLEKVVLSGGVFLNVLLSCEVCARLQRDGFHAYRHRLVPPNDGGLSLGQLAIAASQ